MCVRVVRYVPYFCRHPDISRMSSVSDSVSLSSSGSETDGSRRDGSG